jgi:pyruvate/2-oxoglutarate/acetoin dehydrogenase E1 component
MPYPKHLEDAAVPQPERIVDAVRALMPISVSSR